MGRFVVTRILIGLVTLVLLSMVVFFLPRLTGQDPVYVLLPNDATQQDMDDLREELGLDRPIPTQYWIFIKNAVRGDFGNSVFIKEPVTELIWDRLPATLKLATATALVVIPLGVILGVLCAIRRNRIPDIIGRAVAIAGQSLPSFWVGIMLILLLSVTWGLLPTSGMGGTWELKYYVMPVITLGWVMLAALTRLGRSSMLEALGSDYITFLRAKGLPERSVVAKHALRNAAIGVVTMAAMMFAYMLTGSIVVESVFSWPGLGRLAYESVMRADFPLIQTIVLLYGVIFLFMNFVADVLYSVLDPRIRLQ
ncbi:MAG: ABC transporter permease [Dehalococcoidia bacterium]|nr:ABC transporter permease [Dehalococcoidia bacterium]